MFITSYTLGDLSDTWDCVFVRQDYEEPQDIAASIKALARSVHGDVFELPPPRISTQI